VVTATAPSSTLTTWQIDPAHTLVEFAVRHMMVTTVKGRFAGISGTITSHETDPTRSSVQIEIDAGSVDTREAQRDAHLRSPDFFDVATYPTITFTSTRVVPVGDDRLKVYGDLTIRGVTREVVLEATYQGRSLTPFGTEVVGYSAETTINRTAFGLTWNAVLEAGGVAVADTVKIAIDLEAIRQE
jgi:polyisoprenoid-binding protein YceI